MAVFSTPTRQTKYVNSVHNALKQLAHATNSELLLEVRKSYPKVSATTVHRVTARLRERGMIGYAPKAVDGSERYDINPMSHHHFMCTSCGDLCDIPNTREANEVLKRLQTLSERCVSITTLAVSGICKQCVIKRRNDEDNNL